MTDKGEILGTMLLEWHGVGDLPEMHVEEYEGDTWLQSDMLLLVDQGGSIAMGYCHKSAGEEKEFEITSMHKVGKLRAWAVLGKFPLVGAAQ